MKTFLFLLFALGCLELTVQNEECMLQRGLTGSISHYFNENTKEVCWLIKVPKRHTIIVNVTSFQAEGSTHNGLEILEMITGRNISNKVLYWQQNPKLRFRSDVKIIHFARNKPTSSSNWWSRFTLFYEIVLDIQSVSEARDEAVSLLESQRNPSWGWGENTPRAVTALFLTSAVNFNGTNLEEDLMAKQAKLRIAGTLFRSTISSNELSVLVNALLVTCHNPRNFFGKNLVQQLIGQIQDTENVTHPIAYLALCNANETWPQKAYEDLDRVLYDSSVYPFITDIQAMAIMALSCIGNNTHGYRLTPIWYKSSIRRLVNQQLEDGSFGNLHTTALITQALIASDQEQNSDWNVNKTMEYIIRELNSTSVDFLSLYSILPVLNGKTLVDISKIDCSANPRKHDDDIISEIDDYLGSKIGIKYYLYVGDRKDVIHSISLRVPDNFTAYEVMRFAESQDPKYKFDMKRVSGKIYVYKLANISNDPEVGKFWLQYTYSSNNGTEQLEHFSESLDKVTMKDGQHLIMWYKTAHI